MRGFRRERDEEMEKVGKMVKRGMRGFRRERNEEMEKGGKMVKGRRVSRCVRS